MKNTLKVLMVLMVVGLFCLPVMAQTPIPVANGDFESWTVNGAGGPPDNWTIDNSPALTCPQEGTTVHGGSYSTALTWTSTTNQYLLSDYIACTEGEIYNISAWFYDNDAGGRVRAYYKWYDASQTSLSNSYQNSYTEDNADWQEYTYQETAVASAAYLRIGVVMYDVSGWPGTATVYMDDVTLTEGTGGANQPPTIASVYRYPYPTVFPSDVVDIRAEITDTDGSIVDDSLYYQTTAAILDYTPVYHDSIAGDYYWYHIPAQSAGTFVEYYVQAEDDGAERVESSVYNYTVSNPPNTSLLNPGFEDWTVNGASGPADHWILDTSGLITGAQEGTIVHGGSYSTNLTWTTQTQGDCDFMSEAFNITAEESYVCSLYVYDNDPAGQVTVYFAWNTGNTFTGVYSADQEGWQVVTATASAPVGATSVQFGIRGYDVSENWDGDATVYVDDASFSVASTPPPVVSIYDAQYTVDEGAPLCYPSPYANQIIEVTGTVTGMNQGTYPDFYIQDCSDASWNGLYIYEDTHTLSIGDNVTVIGTISEYHGLTELGGVSSIVTNSSGNAICTTTVTSDDLTPQCNATAEAYEDMLVKLDNVLCVIGTTSGKAWVKSDGATDSCAIDDYMYAYGSDQPADLIAGQRYNIVGQVSCYDTYMLYPRFASDVVLLAAGEPVISNITQDPPSSVQPSDVVTITADITDDGTITQDSIYVQLDAGGYTPQANIDVTGDTYTYEIAAQVEGTVVDYYIIAVDNESNRTVSDTYTYTVSTYTPTCADDIYDVQFTVDAGTPPDCFPSPMDGQTVDLCGIITGQKLAASGYGEEAKFFLQAADGNTWEGVYAYDGSYTPPALNNGDEIEVFASVDEYNGLTELTSITDIHVISSGNDIPAPLNVNVSDFSTGCSFATEAYEGVFVKIDNATVTSGSGGYFWITDPGSVGKDSIQMTNYLYYAYTDCNPDPPIAVDAVYDSVFGCMYWVGNSSNPDAGYWRIYPRCGSDFYISVVPPPVISAVFPVDRATLCILFDHEMDPTSVAGATYTLSDGLTYTNPRIDPNNAHKVLLDVTMLEANDGLASTITVSGVEDIDNVPMEEQTATFHQGFTPIYMIQEPATPDTIATHTSALYGDVVTVRCFATCDSTSYHPTNWFVSDTYSDENGVCLYIYDGIVHTYVPAYGDTFVVTGRVDEYYGETEINTDYAWIYDNMYFISTGPAPAAEHQGTSTSEYIYNDTTSLASELIEGVLCKLCDSLMVVTEANGTAAPYEQLVVSMTTGDTLSLEGQGTHRNYTPPTIGTRIDGLTGIFRWRQGIWRLVPRWDADFNTGLNCGGGGGYEYLPGDANMYLGGWPPNVIGSDVTYLVNFFRGLETNPPCNIDGFYMSADVNASCTIIGSDVTRMVNFFRGTGVIQICPDWEPAWHDASELPPTAPPGWPNCDAVPTTTSKSLNPKTGSTK